MTTTTVHFIAQHNERHAAAEVQRAIARACVRSATRADVYAQVARTDRDEETAQWFERDAQAYRAQADTRFARALAIARGAL
jgi:hypothetical protein